MAGAAFVARRVVRLTPIEALAPAAPYAVSAQSRGPRSGLLALGGLVATAGAALVVAFAPVGSHPELLGLALMLTLAGALLLLPFLVGALSAGSRRAWPQLLGVRGRLAADGLVRAPGRTTVAAGALGLTIALVVASASGLGSFRKEVNRAATTWFAAPLYVRANGEGLLASDQPLPVSLRRRLAAIEGVRAAYPIRAALLERRGQQVAILAFPIAQAARHGDQLTGDVPVRDPRLVAAVGRGQVVASRLTARRHRLHTGSILHVSVARRRAQFFTEGADSLDVLRALRTLLEMECHPRAAGRRQFPVDERTQVALNGAASAAPPSGLVLDAVRTRRCSAVVHTRVRFRPKGAVSVHGCPNTILSDPRARASRDFTVPTATPRASAISS